MCRSNLAEVEVAFLRTRTVDDTNRRRWLLDEPSIPCRSVMSSTATGTESLPSGRLQSNISLNYHIGQDETEWNGGTIPEWVSQSVGLCWWWWRQYLRPSLACRMEMCNCSFRFPRQSPSLHLILLVSSPRPRACLTIRQFSTSCNSFPALDSSIHETTTTATLEIWREGRCSSWASHHHRAAAASHHCQTNRFQRLLLLHRCRRRSSLRGRNLAGCLIESSHYNIIIIMWWWWWWTRYHLDRYKGHATTAPIARECISLRTTTEWIKCQRTIMEHEL